MAILGGPMLATEFMANILGIGCLASEHIETTERIARLFAGTLLSFETSTDVRGVALSGVLKNIYALGFGIGVGLSFGYNQKGWYLKTALSEMETIVERLGGKRESAYSLAGLGDFIATGFSGYSKNSRFGEEIARTGVCALQSEGSASLPFLSELLGRERQAFPLFQKLEDVITVGKDAKETFTQLMR